MEDGGSDRTCRTTCHRLLHPPSRLHSQIGAACGKNSCLFSETDKSIQIMQSKSQPESSWKNLFLATVTDPVTLPSNDIQAHSLPPSSLLPSTDRPIHGTSGPCRRCQAIIPPTVRERPWNRSRACLGFKNKLSAGSRTGQC